MKQQMLRENSFKLFQELEIPNDLISAKLNSLLSEKKNYSPAIFEKKLVHEVLNSNESYLEYISNENKTESNWVNAIYPPTRLKKDWRPKEEIITLLLSLFDKSRIDIGFLREDFKSLHIGKSTINRNWNAEFSKYVINQLSNDSFQKASESTDQKINSNDNYDAKTAQENIKIIEETITILCKKFDLCSHIFGPIPNNWQPSLYSANILSSLEIPRDITYDKIYISAFINNVNTQKIKIKSIDNSYINFVINYRKRFLELE